MISNHTFDLAARPANADAATPPATDAAIAAREKPCLPYGERRPMRRGQKLTEELQTYVVKRLAADESPLAIIRSLQEHHGISMTRMGIDRYDPTTVAGLYCPEKWRKLFYETRQQLREGKADIGAINEGMRRIAPEPARLLPRATPWVPEPTNQPQVDAYHSVADLLLYGGAAGGGKTDLLLGLALTAHERSVIFRRAYVDLMGIEQRLIEILGSRVGYNGNDMVLRRAERLVEFAPSSVGRAGRMTSSGSMRARSLPRRRCASSWVGCARRPPASAAAS
jgi:hypothetical protein